MPGWFESAPQFADVIGDDGVRVQFRVQAAGDVPDPVEGVLVPDPEARELCPQAGELVLRRDRVTAGRPGSWGGTLPNTTEGAVEEMVTARMERQAIMERPEPPLLWAVLDEAVLHRQVSGEKAMGEQLLHMTEMSLRPNVTIEVVPFAAEAHYGLLGAFAVADVDETARVAYLETVTEGYIVESPSVVAEVMLTFDSLRSEALSRSASRDLIMKRAEAYGSDQGYVA